MIEIIPAILTESEEELVRLVHILERAGVTRAHLDVTDGRFVPTRTVNGYSQLHRISTAIKWDIHLMVQNPEQYVDHWWECACADRFIMHVEATDMMDTLADHCHEHGHQLWGAISPGTPVELLTGLQDKLDGATVMTVHPGQQGNPFLSVATDTIKLLRQQLPNLPVMADGGVTPATAPECVAAGASVLVSGSYIMRAADPAKALASLRASVG